MRGGRLGDKGRFGKEGGPFKGASTNCDIGSMPCYGELPGGLLPLVARTRCPVVNTYTM